MDLNLFTQITDLRTISENIDTYLEQEMYKDTLGKGVDTDYTVEDILQECYAIILQELVEFGIDFSCDDGDLLQDWYTAHKLYSLRYFVDANNLREFLANNADDIKLIQPILDNNESEDVFHDVLMALLDKHPDDIYLKDMEYLDRDIVTSYRFRDHVKAVIDVVIRDGENILIPDVERAKRYIEKTGLLRKLASDTSARIIQALSDIDDWDLQLLNKILRDYDLDKISAENIKIYSAIDLDAVSPYLEDIKNKKLDEHHKRSMHHIEYWLDPDKEPRPVPEKEHLVVMVAHHNEPDTTAATFWQEINDMLDKGKELFIPEQVALINRMAEVVYPKE